MTAPKIALVTGASRGIGNGIAQRLVADGLFVIGTATSEAGARAIAETLGERGTGIVMRVDDDDSVNEALAEIAAAFDPVQVLVNNAGITRDNLLMRMTSDEWRAVIDTNLGGLYRLCKPLLRAMMRARWGRIVNLSSVVGRMGNAGQANYAASKAGIEGFSRALAQEVGSRGITVNCVAPGFIETDMSAQLTDAQTEQMLARVPLGRMGAVGDVASAVSFLVSEGAGYVTGETIQVNGGLYLN